MREALDIVIDIFFISVGLFAMWALYVTIREVLED